MKRILALFIILIFILASFAANTDRYNLGSYRTIEGGGFVLYIVTIASTELTNFDSTDSYTTKALYIGEANYEDGYIQAISSAAADVNVILHTSNDLNNWTAHTAQDGLDAVSTTLKSDTLGIISGTDDFAFHNNNWMVLELDGQTGADNEAASYTIIVRLKKQYQSFHNGQALNIGQVVRSQGTP